jgi:choline/glycine/proline betaine transport protein
MGTGLVFFGVAEPLAHAQGPLVAASMPRDEVVRLALTRMFFHWGFHAWAVYITLALGIGLAHYRYGLPLAPRSVLHPLIGDRIHGPIGHGVDILCTVGTLIGVAASLGVGALQVNVGLSRLGVAEPHLSVQLVIIAVITTAATISVVLGIERGIQRLSQMNLVLALVLWSWVLAAGPTTYAVERTVDATGAYLSSLVTLGLEVHPEGPAGDWQRAWTFSTFGWWMAWAPFVGVFVARVSRGRTVREVVLGVGLAPVAASIAWIGVFGASGLRVAEAQGGDGSFASLVVDTPAVALHALLEHLPFGTAFGALATLLTLVFFVTSSDSGSLVDDIVTSGGHPDPPRAQRVFWALSEGAMAATLLAAGGLRALRSATLIVGFPVAILLLLSAAGSWRALRREASRRPSPPDAGASEDAGT